MCTQILPLLYFFRVIDPLTNPPSIFLSREDFSILMIENL